MSVLKTIFLLILILSMQSCVLQAPNSGRKSSILSSSTSGTTSTPAVAPTFASDELAYWFTTTKITGTVTLNKTSQDIIYLRGEYIHEFLSAKDSSGNYNYKKQFCLVANFSNSGFKQTRMRALPLTITTSTTEIKAVANKAVASKVGTKSHAKFGSGKLGSPQPLPHPGP
jgi:hypothetical protein